MASCLLLGMPFFFYYTVIGYFFSEMLAETDINKVKSAFASSGPSGWRYCGFRSMKRL